MCGIVGDIGNRKASDILIPGLKRLEYRGYDSAGIAILNGNLSIFKTAGKVADLEALIGQYELEGTLGIAHTRWATHGEPTDRNAHPHTSQSGKLAIIHNGIIENYAVLKEELINRNYKFTSETDTEVLAYLIEDIRLNEKCDLVEAVRLALGQVTGAYAIAVVSEEEPDLLIAARKGSPLVLGIGEGEYFLASDAAPIVEYTRQVVYLNDYEIAIISRNNGYRIITVSNTEKTPYIQTLELNLTTLEKGGFPHFMLKEIF